MKMFLINIPCVIVDLLNSYLTLELEIMYDIKESFKIKIGGNEHT